MYNTHAFYKTSQEIHLMMSQYVIGIDVGGTNIKLGIVSASGRIIFRSGLVTRGFVRNKNKLIQGLIQFINTSLRRSQIKKKDILGIGIGLPGAVNAQEGIVYYLTNIFGWKNVPLKKIIEKKFSVPVCIDNDVNVIALGECAFGAAKRYNHFLCVTLGTGVGGGLILDNALYRGVSFVAGEVGHIPIHYRGRRCNCGGKGCLETYVGKKYLLQKARKLYGKKMTLEEITKAADKKQKKARCFWKEAAHDLGLALTGVVNLLNLQAIVIGGGISKANPHLLPTIRETIRKRAMKAPGRIVRVIGGKLGNDAGIIGASVLVRNAIKK